MSSPSGKQSPTRTGRKRAPVACTECRRRHVRCKVATREGSPCVRCKSMSLECTYEPTLAASGFARPAFHRMSPSASPVQDPTTPIDIGYYQQPQQLYQESIHQETSPLQDYSRMTSNRADHVPSWSPTLAPYGHQPHQSSHPVHNPVYPPLTSSRTETWYSNQSAHSQRHGYPTHPSLGVTMHNLNGAHLHQGSHEGWYEHTGSTGFGNFSDGVDPYRHGYGRPRDDNDPAVASSHWQP